MNREGIERSAVLLLSLGEEAAAQVLRYLSPFEVSELGKVMHGMGPQPRERVMAVLDEYAEESVRQSGVGTDADKLLDAALRDAVGEEQANVLWTHIAGDREELQKLAWKQPEEIAALLSGEHPQIAAAILARLDVAQASAVVEWLPQEMRPEILRRLAEWQGAPAKALREADEWLAHALDQHAVPVQGEALAADILSRLSPAVRELAEEQLRQDAPALLRSLEMQQLELGDLSRLSGESRARYFKAVPGRTLLLAMKGADPDLVDAVMSRMPGVAAGRLRDDLDALGAVGLKEIESAQSEVVKLLRQLVLEAEIKLDER